MKGKCEMKKGGAAKMHEHHKKEHHMKKGGKAMKKGGHVEGHKAKHRMDKYARGGATESSAKMTPESPMSGAGKMSDRAGLKASSTDREDD